MILLLRWLLLGVLLVVLAFAIWIGEDGIDQMTKIICPRGWWHSGEFWAHCAYRPISISKYGAMYGAFAVLALMLVQVAAPACKRLASRILLLALMIAPVCHLLLIKFSWVESSKLFAVAVVALIFGIAERVLDRRANVRSYEN